MRLDLIRDVVYVVGVPIIALLLWSIVRRVRAIRQLDSQLKAEADSKPANPYADMADLMGDRRL